MMKYNVSLKIDGEDLHLEFKGVTGDISGLENIAKKAIKESPIIKGSKKPELDKDKAYPFLEQGKDYEWFKERYNCTKQQVAGYKAWRTIRDRK